MISENKKTCVACVAENNYFFGLVGTLQSFLAQNRWFTGDVVLYDAGLSKYNKTIIKKLFNKVIFKPVCREKYKFECAKTNRFPKRLLPAFYKFEFFSLDSYDIVIALDTDLLVQSDISLALNNFKDFAACKTLTGTHINTGVMLIGKKYLTSEFRDRLVAGIEKFAGSTADQDVISHFLFSESTKLDPEYNAVRRVWIERGIDLNSARIIHYTGNKPWNKGKLDAADKIWMRFFRKKAPWYLVISVYFGRLSGAILRRLKRYGSRFL